MVLGVIFQPGLGTGRVSATTMQTYCVRFDNEDGSGKSGVIVDYCLKDATQNPSAGEWTTITTDGSGEAPYQFDLDELANGKALYIHWKVNDGSMVGPCNGLKSEFEFSVTYDNYMKNINSHTCGGWSKDGSTQYDFICGYKENDEGTPSGGGQTPDPNPGQGPNPYGLQLSYELVITDGVFSLKSGAHWDNKYGWQYLGDGTHLFVARYLDADGETITPVTANQITVNNPGGSASMTFERIGQTVTDDKGNVFDVIKWTAQNAGSYYINYTSNGEIFSFNIELKPNDSDSNTDPNPGPSGSGIGGDDRSNTGLQLCYIFERDAGGNFMFSNMSDTGAPHWDVDWGWQSYDSCYEMNFVMRYVDGEKNVTALTGSDVTISPVFDSTASMYITDTGKTVSDVVGNIYHVLRWHAPKQIETYHFYYGAASFGNDFDIKLVDKEPYQSGLQLCYGITFNWDNMTASFLYGEDGSTFWNAVSGWQDFGDGTHYFAMRYYDASTGAIVPLAEGDVIGAPVNPNSSSIAIHNTGITLTDKDNTTYQLLYWDATDAGKYRFKYTDNGIKADYVINLNESGFGPGPDNNYGLQIADNLGTRYDDESDTEQYVFWGQPDWRNGFGAYYFVDSCNNIFVIRYIDSEGNITLPDLEDLQFSSGLNVTYTGEEIRDGENVYRIYKWNVPPAAGQYSITLKGETDSNVFNIVMDYQDYGFYLGEIASEETAIIAGDNRQVSVYHEDKNQRVVYVLPDPNIPDIASRVCLEDIELYYWDNGENCPMSAEDAALFVKCDTFRTDNAGNTIAYKLTFADEWPVKYDSLYSYNIEVNYRYYDENGVLVDWVCGSSLEVNRYKPTVVLPDNIYFNTNFIYDANGKATDIENINDFNCNFYRQNCIYGTETDIILRYQDEDGEWWPLTKDDFTLSEGITMTSTGSSVVVNGKSYVVYHLSMNGLGTYSLNCITYENEPVEFLISLPEVGAYDSANRDLSSLYKSSDDGYGPVNITYTSVKPVYFMAENYLNCINTGYMISDIYAQYWDEDGAVKVDVSEFCTIEKISETDNAVRGGVSKDIYKLTFKDEWPEVFGDRMNFSLLVEWDEYDENGSIRTREEAQWFNVNKALYGYNAYVGDDIDFMFNCALDEKLVTDSTLKVNVTVGGSTVTYTSADVLDMNVKGNCKVYEIPCELAPAQLSENVTLSIVTSMGKVIEQQFAFTDYANYILNCWDYSEACRDFVKNLLNYAGYAQDYFGYNNSSAENMANNGLYFENEDPVQNTSGEEIKAEIMQDYSYVESLIQQAKNSEYFQGSSLVCRDKISYNIYLKLEDGITAEDITCGIDASRYSVERSSSSQNIYKVSVKDISICDLDKTYTITIAGKNPGENMALNVSPLMYIYMAQDNANESLVNLTKAIYIYAESGKEYQKSIRVNDPEPWETDIVG